MNKMDRNRVCTIMKHTIFHYCMKGQNIPTNKISDIVHCIIKKEIQAVSHLAQEKKNADQPGLPKEVTFRVSSKAAEQAGERQQIDCSKKNDPDLETQLNSKPTLHIRYCIKMFSLNIYLQTQVYSEN